MKTLITIASLVFLMACHSSTSHQPNEKKPQSNKPDTSYQLGPKIKFQTTLSFEKFKTDTLTGHAKPIDYRSNITAKRFKTAITESYNSVGLNFAGHYNLTKWGCGSPCKAGALVDLKTGKVYDIPSATLGYSFKKDSRLLIINPPDLDGYYEDCSYCKPETWIWNEAKKKFEQSQI